MITDLESSLNKHVLGEEQSDETATRNIIGYEDSTRNTHQNHKCDRVRRFMGTSGDWKGVFEMLAACMCEKGEEDVRRLVKAG